jgi:hypothetical protein
VKGVTSLATFFFGIVSLSHAEVVLPKVIDSHMILQCGLRPPTLHTVFNLSRFLGLQPSQIVSKVEALSPRLG